MPDLFDLLSSLLEHFSNVIDPLLFTILIHQQVKPKTHQVGKSLLLITATGIWLAVSQIYWQQSYLISLMGYTILLLLYTYSFCQASRFQRFFLPSIGALLPLLVNMLLTALASLHPDMMPGTFEPGILRMIMVTAYVLLIMGCYALVRQTHYQCEDFSTQKQAETSVIVLSSIMLCAYIFDHTSKIAQAPELSQALMFSCLGCAMFIAYFLSSFYSTLLQGEENVKLEEMISDAREEAQALQGALVSQEILHNLHHDLRNHFIALHDYAELGEIDPLIEYLKQLEDEFAPARGLLFTKHPGLNAIMSAKLWHAEQKSISVIRRFAAPEELPAADTVICAIMGNLLDNAIEGASRVVPPAERRMWLTAYVEDELWHIEISNTYTGTVIRDKERYLSTKEKPGHGRGLPRVIQLIQQTAGKIAISNDEHKFTVLLCWPLACEATAVVVTTQS